MNELVVERQPPDLAMLGQGAPQLQPNVSAPAVVRDPAGEVLAVVARYPGDLGAYRRAVRAYPMRETYRQAGIQNRSRVFGFQGRAPLMKRQCCRASGGALDAPGPHAAICAAAGALALQLSELVPERAEADTGAVQGKVRPCWLLHPAAPWTSGVVNGSSPLPYHFDANNFPTWSAMTVVRRGMRGGHLHLPQLGLVLECRDGDVVYFDGQATMHGVTPMRQTEKDGYRYTAVYYAVAGMARCLDFEEELARGRANRSRIEDGMVEAQRAAGLMAPGACQAPTQAPLVLTGSLSRLALPLRRWCHAPVVAVEPQEADAYRQAHPTVDLVELPRSGGGFSFLMNELCRLALARGHRWFVFSDDDVTDLRVRDSLEGRWRPARGDDAAAVLADLVATAEQENLAQLAVSFAGQAWGAKVPWQEPVGAWGVHVTDAQAVLNVGGYDEGLPIFGDWEMSARLLRSGRRVARTNLVAFVHKMRSMEGGAAGIYADPDRVHQAAVHVAARYPGAAAVRWVEAHGLHEVRFNWRRLAAAAAP